MVAGSTGYLCQFVEKKWKKGFWVYALARDKTKLDNIPVYVDEIFVGEVTQRETLEEINNDFDIGFSSVGLVKS